MHASSLSAVDAQVSIAPLAAAGSASFCRLALQQSFLGLLGFKLHVANWISIRQLPLLAMWLSRLWHVDLPPNVLSSTRKTFT
jgi:hypothetical protein